MQSLFEKNGGTYRQEGGYLIPNLDVPKQNGTIGKSGRITYIEAEFNARNRIYQSVKPDFNPDEKYKKDPLSRDIPSVDNSLFILARKLILESK